MLFHKKLFEDRLKDYDFSPTEEYQRIFKKWSEETRKEESIQSDFLNDVFGKFLGYEIETDKEEYHLEKEKKTQTDGTKPDGSLGSFSLKKKLEDTRVVIELKGKYFKDWKKMEEQAFQYKDKIENIEWVIISNTSEIRLYSAHSGGRIAYESWNFLDLSRDKKEIKKFHFCCAKDRLYTKEREESPTHKLLKDGKEREKNIENEFYKQYSQIRLEIWEELKQNHSQSPEFLLSKTQKILDRMIFICFAEDRFILPNNSLKKIKDFPLMDKWTLLKNLFHKINEGDSKIPIDKINGGLFQSDKDLDDLNLSDETVEKLLQLSEWDFSSELSINILGHIFEQSISDLEKERAKIQNQDYDSKKGKQKRDGIFYTPEAITRYIVEQTVGAWITEKRKNLKLYEITDEEKELVQKKKQSRQSKKIHQKIEHHLKQLKDYSEELKKLKVLDPACGSGAFLVQVFDFLEREWKRLKEEMIDYFSCIGKSSLFHVTWNYKDILQKNIYGVDKNLDSVLITRLSLWLKTANKKETLTTLDDNIKVGDSLIDDKKIAGTYRDEDGQEKSLAFDWKQEFPEVFQQGGFDVIVGNPPYIFARDNKFLDSEKKYYYNKYKFSNYQINTYSLFIEQSTRLLKNDRFLGFIVPNNWLTIHSFEYLRTFILTKTYNTKIINTFSDVFNKASVDTCILIFKILFNEEKLIDDFITLGEINNTNIEEKITEKKNIINQEKKIIIINHHSEGFKIIEKINLYSQELQLVSEVLSGIKSYETGKGTPKQTNEMKQNRVYHSFVKKDESYLKYLEGQDVQRYNLSWSKEYISYGKWLAAPRKKVKFKSSRILVRQIPSKLPYSIQAVFIKDYYINDMNSMIIQDIQINELFVLSIINSKLISFWFDFTFNKFSRTIFPQFKVTELKKFPIPKIDIEQQKSLIEKADTMLKLNQELHKKTQDFLNLIQAEFKNPDRFSQNLKKFYQLELDIFLEELTKLSKKQKINFSLKQKEEWSSFFKEKKSLLQEIQNHIQQTDRDIDSMVYKLYDLNQEEIQIVEKED